jgi:hypothetical protein
LIISLITIDKLRRDLLMAPASLVLSPKAPVLFCLSEPAKSIIWKTLFCIFERIFELFVF